jgi:hypothetical protein
MIRSRGSSYLMESKMIEERIFLKSASLYWSLGNNAPLYRSAGNSTVVS